MQEKPLESNIQAETEQSIEALSPRTRKFSLAKEQESTRSQLAKVLIGLFSVTSLCMLGIISLKDNFEEKDFATIILTSQGTLVGTALGFYFGDRS